MTLTVGCIALKMGGTSQFQNLLSVTQNDTLLELFTTGKIPAELEDANTCVPEPLIKKPVNRNDPLSSMEDDDWFWDEAA